MKTITLNGQVYRLDATPSCFSWTPEMSAIWPAEYRPTMSGLLAIWEAMHEAAIYPETASQPSTTDWNEWNGGSVIPTISELSVIDVELRNGVIRSGVMAERIDWSVTNEDGDVRRWRYLQRDKPSSVADADGWISHRAGDPAPVGLDELVEWKSSVVPNGSSEAAPAQFLYWPRITHWRPAK